MTTRERESASRKLAHSPTLFTGSSARLTRLIGTPLELGQTETLSTRSKAVAALLGYSVNFRRRRRRRRRLCVLRVRVRVVAVRRKVERVLRAYAQRHT